jgi:hypothetical protein
MLHHHLLQAKPFECLCQARIQWFTARPGPPSEGPDGCARRHREPLRRFPRTADKRSPVPVESPLPAELPLTTAALPCSINSHSPAKPPLPAEPPLSADTRRATAHLPWHRHQPSYRSSPQPLLGKPPLQAEPPSHRSSPRQTLSVSAVAPLSAEPPLSTAALPCSISGNIPAKPPLPAEPPLSAASCQATAYPPCHSLQPSVRISPRQMHCVEPCHRAAVFEPSLPERHQGPYASRSI